MDAAQAMFMDKSLRGPRLPVEGQDGNWRCGNCAEINFASRTECHRCKSPYAAAVLGSFGQGFGGMPLSVQNKGGAPIEGVGGNWRCTSCANVNFAKREHCNRCQVGRPPFDHILAREQELEQERAVAAASGATLQANMAGRKFAPPIAGVDGNWECLTCMSINFASREQCHRCASARPPQEHIMRRAEQIKAERAVQLTTPNTNNAPTINNNNFSANINALPAPTGGAPAPFPTGQASAPAPFPTGQGPLPQLTAASLPSALAGALSLGTTPQSMQLSQPIGTAAASLAVSQPMAPAAALPAASVAALQAAAYGQQLGQTLGQALSQQPASFLGNGVGAINGVNNAVGAVGVGSGGVGVGVINGIGGVNGVNGLREHHMNAHQIEPVGSVYGVNGPTPHGTPQPTGAPAQSLVGGVTSQPIIAQPQPVFASPATFGAPPSRPTHSRNDSGEHPSGWGAANHSRSNSGEHPSGWGTSVQSRNNSGEQPYPGADVVGAADWAVGCGALGGAPLSDAINVSDGLSSDELKRQSKMDAANPRRERLTRGMPLRRGDCSSWVAAGGLIFVSQHDGGPIEGLTEGCDLASSYADRQTLCALANLEALLQTAGTSTHKLVEVTLTVCYHEDLEAVQAGWNAWTHRLEGQLPAKTVLFSPPSTGREGCRVEIRAIAMPADTMG